jgi:omega-6 fatty acid desaturase (delta-12 desaturase)
MTASSQTVPNTWRKAVAPFQSADVRISIWQVVNTLVPFFFFLYMSYRALEVGYWLTVLLAILTAGFAIRMFIIFHDAGHGSFFPSKTANDWIGRFTGVFLLTPYYSWRHSHAIHHATSGDLDRRGTGDIWTLTYDEFHTMPRWKQLAYRVYRNPFIIFVIGPAIDFIVLQRFCPSNQPDARERTSVRHTNLAILAVVIVCSLLAGLTASPIPANPEQGFATALGQSFLTGLGIVVAVYFPVIVTASIVGVWMFYVQHQYEDVYWERHENWDFAAAALHGSSFYKLPKVLQWFTGNIGFHHIHHLSPRIPNYKLEECHESDELFRNIEPMTFWSSLRSMHVRLWDEDHHKLIGYKREGEGSEEALKEQPQPN